MCMCVLKGQRHEDRKHVLKKTSPLGTILSTARPQLWLSFPPWFRENAPPFLSLPVLLPILFPAQTYHYVCNGGFLIDVPIFSDNFATLI